MCCEMNVYDLFHRGMVPSMSTLHSLPSTFLFLLSSRPQRHAAENLVDVVARIFAAVVDGRRSITLRKVLLQWRSWYMLRVSVQLHNRQRLRNW